MAEGYPVAGKTSLTAIRRRLRAELNRLEIDPALSFDCLVAVTEACTNALVHGMEDSETPHPELSWEIGRSSARFSIRDFSAQGWAMAAHPSGGLMDLSRDEFERRVGGFGLPIMRQLMDDVDIKLGARGTTVILTKQFA